MTWHDSCVKQGKLKNLQMLMSQIILFLFNEDSYIDTSYSTAHIERDKRNHNSMNS